MACIFMSIAVQHLWLLMLVPTEALSESYVDGMEGAF